MRNDPSREGEGRGRYSPCASAAWRQHQRLKFVPKISIARRRVKIEHLNSGLGPRLFGTRKSVRRASMEFEVLPDTILSSI